MEKIENKKYLSKKYQSIIDEINRVISGIDNTQSKSKNKSKKHK